MKAAAALFGAAGAALTLLAPRAHQAKATVIVTGNTLGYLSPCGCSTPMTGGVLREASAVMALAHKGPALILNTGNLVEGEARQDALKAETLIQAFVSMGTAAINLSAADAKLGRGELLQLAALSRGRLTTASLAPSETNQCSPNVSQDGFLIFGVSTQARLMASRLGQVAVPVDQAIQANLSEARAESLTPLLLLDGDRSQAVDLAKRFPDLVLIAYQSSGRPPLEVETSGATALMSPGSRGQYFVSLDLAGTDKTNYETHGLGPEIKDDPAASRLFHTYLKYVSEENLWEKTPKFPSPKFAGSERCGSCHRESLSVWRTSAHHRSLKTLRDKQEDKDPECIPCHVTGASLLTGFKSPFATPDLAFVGCESCHGPGLAHSLHPKSERMAKVGEQSCAPCHRSLNSPGFVFFRYWQQIAHKR